MRLFEYIAGEDENEERAKKKKRVKRINALLAAARRDLGRAWFSGHYEWIASGIPFEGVSVPRGTFHNNNLQNMNKVQRVEMYKRIIERVEELQATGYSKSAACGIAAVEEGVSLTHVYFIVNKKYKMQADGVDRAETGGTTPTERTSGKAS